MGDLKLSHYRIFIEWGTGGYCLQEERRALFIFASLKSIHDSRERNKGELREGYFLLRDGVTDARI
jgi:hypothetical protein